MRLFACAPNVASAIAVAAVLSLLCGRGGADEVAEPRPLAELAIGKPRSAARPSWLLGPKDFKPEHRSGRSCITIPESVDPYEDVPWRIQMPAAALGTNAFTIELEFFDEGAGCIAAHLVSDRRPGGVGERGDAGLGVDAGVGLNPDAARRASYTRLNTGQFRKAWFEFAGLSASGRADRSGVAAAAGARAVDLELRVTGLQFLAAVRVWPKLDAEHWRMVRRSVPVRVTPMVHLRKPMQLVTTAGVDVLGDMSTLDASLEAMTDLAPLARVLGFTSIESYVTWKRLEPVREGSFDFAYYDAVVNRLKEYDLKWFPLLVVGSGYALPDWFLTHPDMTGFVCLEHNRSNSIQSIWNPAHRRHVTRVLEAFGHHYGPMGVLEGVRLGPSGNYGESQYPASGGWGAKGEKMHLHIGWWAGDEFGRADFRRWLKAKYGAVAALNRAWNSGWRTFDDVAMQLPNLMVERRERLDFTAWYTDSMTDWCEWWAREARKALPATPIYQSAGGWGFREAGTDYSGQTKSMKDIDGGVRLTNETDSYEQNYYATQLAATAARLYGVDLGFEPASSHTARGVVGRIFHTMETQGTHLFTYHNNVFDHPMAIRKWLQYLPFLDLRRIPRVEVALYYPETENQMSDAPFRHLYAWGFNPMAREIRRQVPVDYLDDRLIRDGFLDRYKALVFTWGNHIEADVRQIVDAWVQKGGVVIYPSFPRTAQETIEGDTTVFGRWTNGDTGNGAFRRFKGDMEPPSLFGDFVRAELIKMRALSPATHQALVAAHPLGTFLWTFDDGQIVGLNYNAQPASFRLPGAGRVEIEGYGIAVIKQPLPNR